MAKRKKNVRIRLLGPVAGRVGDHDSPAGVIEVSEDVAEAWCDGIRAVPAAEQAIAPPVGETRSVDALHTGGGWYELPDGSKVRGRDAAEAALGEQ